MALIQCPECKKNLSETATNCPKCGWQLTPEGVAQIKKQQASNQKKLGFGCLGIVAFFVLIAIFGSLSSKNEPSKPTNAVVINSQWDGSVSQVKDWLEQNVKDPDSLEYSEWSPVMTTADGFRVRVKYRAKNGFGGYEVEERFFTLDHAGNVINVSDPR